MNPDPAPALSVVPGAALRPDEAAELVALLGAAFDMDYAPYLASFTDPVHVLARRGGEIVSHALWIPRTLEHAAAGPLRTAYVEAVATAAAHQGRGYATAVMRRLADEVRAAPGFRLAALSTHLPEFYARLGWRVWRGPRGVRTATGIQPTPGETVMILPLSGTPPLDEDALLTVEWREIESW